MTITDKSAFPPLPGISCLPGGSNNTVDVPQLLLLLMVSSSSKSFTILSDKAEKQ